jgi:hypothetical protein
MTSAGRLTLHHEERRQYPRTEVLARAYIVNAAPSNPSTPCTVRNLSPIGALVRLRSPNDLARVFTLLVNGTELLSCKIIWVSGLEIGLEFARRR